MKSFAVYLGESSTAFILHCFCMKLQNVIVCLSALALCSCKSLKNLTSRDNSSSQKSTANNANHNVQFIDGIAVTPGGMVKNEKNITAANTTDEPKVVYAPPPFILTNINIENADPLALKYAIVLDATLEQLTNLQLLKVVDHWWGTPYCMGGSTENCIDCSAFVQTLMLNVYGIDVPRTAQQQYDNCAHIDITQLEEGDLVFFHTSGNDASHVGVYLLNNKFVHASSSSGVTVGDLNDSYWRPRFIGAGRVRK